jgi:hypothetical protein
VKRLRDAVLAGLREEKYRRAASEVREVDGLERATDIIEDALTLKAAPRAQVNVRFRSDCR